MIKAVIFDLDGVLTSTDIFHYLAWKEIADKEGIYFDEEINRRLRGVSRMDSLDIILENSQKEYTEEEKEELATLKNNLYLKHIESLSQADLLDGVLDTINQLKKSNIKLAVGSSSKNTNKILEKLGIKDLFDVIVDGNMITYSKPDPEVFLLAAKLLNISSSECAVIEDATSGIDAANSGGFISCYINYDEEYDKARYHFKNISDIFNLIEVKEGHYIKLEHIKKVYPNGVLAVKDFNLEIEPGEFVVFVGPSGCGKSTVLRMVAGLEEITDGALYIDGVDMTDTEPKERDIAMVFQNYALYPHKTVKENIGFSLYMQSVPFKHFFDFKWRRERKRQIDREVEEVAEKIGLTDYLNRKPANLSGGQRQRVALGRSIIRHPKAFLLDEPLSNLDAKMRAGMRTEISKLHNELKTIFIYVTHDQIEAMTMGTKIVVMKDGVIQQIGTPSEVFMNPVNRFVAGFIGTPQMNFFDVTLEKEGIRFDDDHIIPISNELLDRIDSSYINKKITLGLRPKAISVSDDSDFKVNVSICEQLGDEALVYFNYEGIEHVLSMSTYQSFDIGSLIGLKFNLEHVSMFDIETGESILQ